MSYNDRMTTTLTFRLEKKEREKLRRKAKALGKANQNFCVKCCVANSGLAGWATLSGISRALLFLRNPRSPTLGGIKCESGTGERERMASGYWANRRLL
jgi:hypothetical protein